MVWGKRDVLPFLKSQMASNNGPLYLEDPIFKYISFSEMAVFLPVPYYLPCL